VTFLLLPEFSMMPFTAAMEALRAANRMSGAQLYRWQTATLDGDIVPASNGVGVHPDVSLAQTGLCDMLVVCAGLNAGAYASSAMIAQLRRLARSGVTLGAVCTGSVVLARGGLLDGYRCTIHWEDVASFAENFPQLQVTSRLYEIDRDRFTCSGGTAPLDLMIHFIAADFGAALAVQVAELMLHHTSRPATEPQRLSLRERTGVANPGLLAAIAGMEAAIETPASVEKIAVGAGLSPRQLERLFHDHLRTSPSRYYLALRLDRARHLLRHTSAPVLQVAVATGFTSAAHFAKCYRTHFGAPPRNERRISGGATG